MAVESVTLCYPVHYCFDRLASKYNSAVPGNCLFPVYMGPLDPSTATGAVLKVLNMLEWGAFLLKCVQC